MCFRDIRSTAITWLCIPVLSLVTACDSSVVKEAKQAESSGSVISNEFMLAQYPESFRPGDPPYLERDFEAGADFICDEIALKYHRDMCSDPQINWRD